MTEPELLTKQDRLVFIDVIKVIAIAVVIAHHVGQAYGPGAADWIVDDAAMAVWLKAFFQVNAAFGMGLMFFIAGYFVPRSYDRKGDRRFLSERWKRIGVPMTVMIVTVHLPVAYFTQEAELSPIVVASEPAHLPQYVALFAVGAMAYRGDWLRRFSTRMGMIWLAIGVTASAAIYYMTLFAEERYSELSDTGGFTAASLLFRAWEAVICVGLCIGLMVLGRVFFQRTNRFVIALSAAAYAAYMLHLAVVVAIQAAILDVDASANSKFLFVAGLGIFLPFGFADSARRVPGLRNLLGVAPASNEKAGEVGERDGARLDRRGREAGMKRSGATN